MENKFHDLGKYGLIMCLSLLTILFGQYIKCIFHPEMAKFDVYSITGAVVLWVISMLGLIISLSVKNNSILSKFPILGWVSIVSLIMCFPAIPLSNFIIKSINSVDVLAITTPILTYAGISVVNRIPELRKTSWKIAIVAIFVFMGTYIGSASIAEIGLRFFAGR